MFSEQQVGRAVLAACRREIEAAIEKVSRAGRTEVDKALRSQWYRAAAVRGWPEARQKRDEQDGPVDREEWRKQCAEWLDGWWRRRKPRRDEL